MKAYDSKEVSVKEFLDFQIEAKLVSCTPLEIDELTSFKDAIDSPNQKVWIDVMRDEKYFMAGNKV